ncbi:hypothetical protein [Caudoviricetes sp.]|nr:hypothetical protein [Caudoviricetes sp.]
MQRSDHENPDLPYANRMLSHCLGRYWRFAGSRFLI